MVSRSILEHYLDVWTTLILKIEILVIWQKLWKLENVRKFYWRVGAEKLTMCQPKIKGNFWNINKIWIARETKSSWKPMYVSNSTCTVQTV